MSNPVVDLATEAARAGTYPQRFNKREEKLLEAVKDYADNLAPNNVITTEGDLIIGDSGGDAERLAIGTTGYTVVSDGTTLAWAQLDTAGLADGAVTLAKLDAGVAPAYVVKYAGTFTTLGGDATETITVTGAAATDFVFVQLWQVGGTPRTVLTAVPTTNTVTVTFSGDPSTDHKLFYQVLRAAT
jgi:hypothetical protein